MAMAAFADGQVAELLLAPPPECRRPREGGGPPRLIEPVAVRRSNAPRGVAGGARAGGGGEAYPTADPHCASLMPPLTPRALRGSDPAAEGLTPRHL